MVKVKLTRSYKLQILPNFQKLEDIKYTASRYQLYLQHFVTQLYYNSHVKFYSTKGMGMLANQAQHQAFGIIRGETKRAKANGNKSNCPQIISLITPAKIQPSEGSSFDYWISINSQWKNKILVPARSHKKLNQVLRDKWLLSEYCEISKDKNNKWYVKVFVTKELDKAIPQSESLGVDVGIAHSASRSDGYLGKNLKLIIRKAKVSQAERQRQGHKKVSIKSSLKQQLDVEVNRAITRCKQDSLNLVVENPKTLANLRTGKLQGWARCYFANRAIVRAKEECVFIWGINPRNTSITCSNCGVIDKQSRAKQDAFRCVACGNTVNADYNASLNIARIGQVRISKYFSLQIP